MSDGVDTALRVLGKLMAGLFGAGLLAWAGVTMGERFLHAPSGDVDVIEERLQDAETDASAAWRAVMAQERRADHLEARVKRLEARSDARGPTPATSAPEAAPAAPARPQKPRRRKPAPPAAALPPASSHWRF